jgi:PAS domain-containing protein
LRHRYPLPLHHSWPLFESAQHFDLGWTNRASVRPPEGKAAAPFDNEEAMARMGVGLWRCDLADDRLTWSDTVFDLFGFPREAAIARADAVAQYCEGSRVAMERLRAHAITHRRGFTLDVELGGTLPRSRWIRLIAAPVCEGDTVVALQGLKFPAPDHGGWLDDDPPPRQPSAISRVIPIASRNTGS